MFIRIPHSGWTWAVDIVVMRSNGDESGGLVARKGEAADGARMAKGVSMAGRLCLFIEGGITPLTSAGCAPIADRHALRGMRAMRRSVEGHSSTGFRARLTM